MKTKPVDDLLPLLTPETEPYLNLYYEALHELVCFGTHMLSWILEQNSSKDPLPDETALVVPLLFRNIIELLDSVSIQVRAGSIIPCKIQLRAILEAYMNLEYLLEVDAEKEYRASCFMLVDHYRKLNYFKQLSPNTPENKKLVDSLRMYSSYMKDFESKSDALKAFSNQEFLVNQPIYDSARNVFLKLTRGNTSNLDLKWYSLVSQTNSLKALAKKLNKYELYEFFYKSWSNNMHSTDLTTGVLIKEDDGNGAIVQLRYAKEAHSTTTQAILFFLLIIDLVTTKVIPEHKNQIQHWKNNYKINYRDNVSNIIFKYKETD